MAAHDITVVFRVRSRDDIIRLGSAFSAVARQSPLDFSRPDHVISVGLEGAKRSGKTRFATAFIESLGVSDVRYKRAVYETYKTKEAGLVRHADASSLYVISSEPDMRPEEMPKVNAFRQPRDTGGVDLIEWSKDYENRICLPHDPRSQDRKLTSKDFKVSFQEGGEISYEDLGFSNLDEMRQAGALSDDKLKTRYLVVSCSQEQVDKPGFNTFLSNTQDLIQQCNLQF